MINFERNTDNERHRFQEVSNLTKPTEKISSINERIHGKERKQTRQYINDKTEKFIYFSIYGNNVVHETPCLLVIVVIYIDIWDNKNSLDKYELLVLLLLLLSPR